MILNAPFLISSRLMPALKIGDACLSFDPETCEFFLDTPDFEYLISDFRPGLSRDVQSCFEAMLSFMDAAGESRRYRVHFGRGGENEDLFPPHVVDWIVDQSDEIGALRCWIDEQKGLIQ